MLVFVETEKLEYPKKNFSEQRTNKLNTHMTPSLGIEPGATLIGGESSHHCASPAVSAYIEDVISGIAKRKQSQQSTE